MLEKNEVQGFGIKAEHLNRSVGPVPPARSLWLTGTRVSAPVQSCGGTAVKAVLQEVTWGLQKGNGLKKKKFKKIHKQMFTDMQQIHSSALESCMVGGRTAQFPGRSKYSASTDLGYSF